MASDMNAGQLQNGSAHPTTGLLGSRTRPVARACYGDQADAALPQLACFCTELSRTVSSPQDANGYERLCLAALKAGGSSTGNLTAAIRPGLTGNRGPADGHRFGHSLQAHLARADDILQRGGWTLAHPGRATADLLTLHSATI